MNKFVVQLTDENGDDKVFGVFESSSDAKAWITEMISITKECIDKDRCRLSNDNAKGIEDYGNWKIKEVLDTDYIRKNLK